MIETARVVFGTQFARVMKHPASQAKAYVDAFFYLTQLVDGDRTLTCLDAWDALVGNLHAAVENGEMTPDQVKAR